VYVTESKEAALGHSLMGGNVPPELPGLGVDRVAEQVKDVLERV
jgi:hypothetical protein